MEEYRGYRLLLNGMNLVYILNPGKGAVPRFLSGNYTNRAFAAKDIDAYLASKEKD